MAEVNHNFMQNHICYEGEMQTLIAYPTYFSLI